MRRDIALVTVALLFGACAPRATPQPDAAPRAATIDSVALLRDVSVLSHDSMEGRLVATPGSVKAQRYIEQRFRDIGLQPLSGAIYGQPFEFTRGNPPATVRGLNLVGMVRGTALPERYIVVSAHYDHVGVRSGEIYNGADDNASGTAGLLALARYFTTNRPRHSIIFAAFDAEEGGLRGARAFVAAPPVPKEAIVLNVNMDMISRNDAGELYVAGTHHYPHLLPIVQRVIPVAEVKLIPGHDRPELGQGDWTSQSDHGAFHQAGIPFLYFGVEDHPDYHRPTDDFERIQPGFYTRAVRTVLATIRQLDSELGR